MRERILGIIRVTNIDSDEAVTDKQHFYNIPSYLQ